MQLTELQKPLASDPEQLGKFIDSLQDYVPTVPDELTQHYLRKSGIQCTDIRLVRLFSLAAHRFIAGVTTDTLQLQKQDKSAHPKQGSQNKGHVLRSEQLGQALQEYGLNLQRPPYYASQQQQQQQQPPAPSG